MPTLRKLKSRKKVSARDAYVRSEIRFSNREELEFVKRAAEKDSRSLNGWMVKVLKAAAIAELRES